MLHFVSICSVGILDVLQLMAKTAFSTTTENSWQAIVDFIFAKTTTLSEISTFATEIEGSAESSGIFNLH